MNRGRSRDSSIHAARQKELYVNLPAKAAEALKNASTMTFQSLHFKSSTVSNFLVRHTSDNINAVNQSLQNTAKEEK